MFMRLWAHTSTLTTISNNKMVPTVVEIVVVVAVVVLAVEIVDRVEGSVEPVDSKTLDFHSSQPIEDYSSSSLQDSIDKVAVVEELVEPSLVFPLEVARRTLVAVGQALALGVEPFVEEEVEEVETSCLDLTVDLPTLLNRPNSVVVLFGIVHNLETFLAVVSQ